MILQDSVLEKETSELESSEAAQESQEGFCSSQLLRVLNCTWAKQCSLNTFISQVGCHNLSWIWTTPKTLLLKNVEHSRDTEGEIMDILAFEWSLFCRFHGFPKINKSNTLYFCCLRNSMHHLHLPGLSGENWNCSSDFKLQHGQASKAQSSADLIGSDHSRRRTWWPPWSPWSPLSDDVTCDC